MDILLDTCVFLWWMANHRALSKKAKTLIANPEHTIYISAITTWEISIKKQLGKLQAPDGIVDAIKANHFMPLAIKLEHGTQAGELPPHHQDPFDRMLIAQSQIEQLSLISNDQQFSHYDIDLIKV